MPSSNAFRNFAGSVRRFLSSIVCSYSPRSMGPALPIPPLRPTINHNVPQVHSSWTTPTPAARRGPSGLDAGLGGSEAGRERAQERLRERRLRVQELREAAAIDRQRKHLLL